MWTRLRMFGGARRLDDEFHRPKLKVYSAVRHTLFFWSSGECVDFTAPLLPTPVGLRIPTVREKSIETALVHPH